MAFLTSSTIRSTTKLGSSIHPQRNVCKRCRTHTLAQVKSIATRATQSSSLESTPNTAGSAVPLYTNASYVLDSAGFRDYQPDGRRPLSVRVFQLPGMAWVYERGWRAIFTREGFPGPEGEIAAACAHIGEANRVLDCSCATGVLTRRLMENYNQVIGLDFSSAMLTEALRRGAGEYVRADVGNMPFADGAFDGVVAGAALHCWPSPRDALVEIRRVLRPGGAFYATTFSRDAFGGSLVHEFSPYLGAYRFFWADELYWLCKGAGFEQVEVDRVKNFLSVRCRR